MSDTSGLNTDSMLAASHAAPGLDPESVYGLAQVTPDPTEAAQNAQGTQGFGDALTIANTLKQHDNNTQNKLWKSYSDSERAMLGKVGYAPPHVSHESFFHRAVSDVGDVASTVLGEPAHAITSAAAGGLHILGAPLRGVQRAYRAAALVTDENEQNGSGRWALGNLKQWAQAWNDANHGEKTFLPSRVAAITQKYGQDTTNLARSLASGDKTPDELIQAQPTDVAKQQMAQRLQTDKTLQSAVTEFQNAKISFGRRVVGQSLFQSNPALAHKLSGALDATADIFADPVMHVGAVAKAVGDVPYALKAPEMIGDVVSDGGRVGEILQKPAAQRFLNAADDALKSDGGGNIGALTRRFSQLEPVAQQLSDAGVQSGEDLGKWFQTQAGLKAMMEGKVTNVATHDLPGSVLVPHLSTVGAAALPAKEALGKAIDWAATHRVPVVNTLANMADRISMLRIPVGEKVGTNPEQDVTFIRRLGDYAFGGVDAQGNKITRQAVDNMVNAWVANPTYETYKGLLSTVMDGMKVDPAFKDQFFGKLEGDLGVHNYGVGDKLMLNGQPVSTGFTENHVMDQGWSVPDFRAMRMAADKGWTVDKLYGGINGDKANMFMGIWKPAQLLRLGMPIRTAGEELVAAALRSSPLDMLRAAAARSSLREGDFQPLHPLAKALDLFTSHLPDSVASKIDTPRDVFGEVIGDRTRRAFRDVEGRLAGQKYVDAAKRMADVAGDSGAEEWSAVHQHGAGFLDTVENAKQMTRDGTLGKPMYLQPGDTYRNYAPQENLYTRIWQKNLDEYSQDRLTRAALGAADQGEAAQIQAVVDKLNDPSMNYVVNKAARSRVTLDGRVVGEDATREEALRDWATTVVKNANHVTQDAAGNRIDEIFNAVNAGKTPDITALNNIPEELRPTTMNGREMIQVPGPNKFREYSDKGFGRIGRMINWISREPMMIHNMADSTAEMEAMRPMFAAASGADANAEHITQQLSEMAWTRALNKTIPFIHDPSVRSMFSEDARNLAPFMFAQEQFFKRWAMTAVHSPEAFREAQLTMGGIRDMGFVHKDPQTGQDYFMYPGAGMVQNVLSKAVSAFTGHDVTLPIPVGFSGQVRFATPGTERLGAPSFGPLVSIPMRAITSRFPELSQLEQTVVGDRGAGRPYWEQVAPASLTRVIHGLVDNPETSPQMHSATLQAMQYLEATGHGLPDDANPLEQEKWQDRVKSWTRILMFTRAIYGFSAPAAPQLEMDPKHLHQEFSQLVSQMPVGRAVTEFMRRHPNATPYTVFQTKSESGAPLPATTGTMDFMNQHEDFLKTYPQASAWFLPQQSKDAQFSQPAYREQMALGLRQKKGTDEYYKDIKFAEAATDYFDTKDGRDARLAAARAAGDTAQVDAINKQWSDWSAPYLAAHPIFRDQLLSSQGAIRRQQTVDQLTQAMNDPNLPTSTQTVAIRDMVDTYNGLQSRLAQFKGQRDKVATDSRKAQTAQFVDWAHSYVKDHPEVEGLYNTVFRLLVGDGTDATATTNA